MLSDKLNHYLTNWDLQNPHFLAQTPTSHVYTVDSGGTTVALKLLTPIGEVDEQPGAVALRFFDGHGAVRLLREDGKAHLLEYASGDDLTGMVQNGDDEGAARIIGGILNQLHRVQTDSPPAGLHPLDVRFRALFAKAERDKQHRLQSIYMRASSTAEKLLAAQTQVRVLHGDMHHANIRFSPQRGWLAFDPKGVYGERTYDAANTLCNPGNMSALVETESRILTICGVLAEIMQVDFKRLVTWVYVYACLSACWSGEDHEIGSAALRIAALAEPHIMHY